MDDETDDVEMELVMPFVTVTSRGGPHDDEAYTAGWEMGQMNERLRAALHYGLGPPTVTIRRANLPQLELIAMQYGMVAHELDMRHLDEETQSYWAHVELVWGTSL